MNKLFLGLLIFLGGWVFSDASAQTAMEYNGETVYNLVEKRPEYPGGEEALAKFLRENIVYPEIGKLEGKQGKVYVQFYVTKTGELVNVHILKGIREDFDNEVLRVVKLMPNWTPGEQGGQPVHVVFNLPIDFRLK